MSKKRLLARKLRQKKENRNIKTQKRREVAIREARERREKGRLEMEIKKKVSKAENERVILDSMTEEEKNLYIKKRLEHNMKILQAMENDYLSQENARNDLHERLEAEGYHTLEEKLEALKNKSEEYVKQQGEEE